MLVNILLIHFCIPLMTSFSMKVFLMNGNLPGAPLYLKQWRRRCNGQLLPYFCHVYNCDISWDFHVRHLCLNTYYHIYLLRKLRRIFSKHLPGQVLKLYPISFRLEYFCSIQKDINMHFDIDNHDTRKVGSLNVYLPTVDREMLRNSYYHPR